MKLFRLDLKDRYRRGLAQGARTARSPQTESSDPFQHDHDPHHQATSPTSPSVLFSAGIPVTKTPSEHLEQWDEFGVSPLEAVSSSSSTAETTTSRGGGGAMNAHTTQTHSAHPHYSRVGGRYLGRQYDHEEEYDDDGSSDGYMSSSSSSSGGSISSSGSSSLSPYYSSDDDNCNDDDEDNDGDDEGSESDYSHAEDENLENCRDASSDARSNGIDSSSFSYYGNSNSSSSSNSKHRGGHRQRPIVDYYDGQRHRTGEHAGLLPPAPAPAIVPMADRSAIEYEARQRRWERHVDKRRQSLNGSQPPPTPRRKKRKKAKDLRKQVLLKNAQYLAD